MFIESKLFIDRIYLSSGHFWLSLSDNVTSALIGQRVELGLGSQLRVRVWVRFALWLSWHILTNFHRNMLNAVTMLRDSKLR